MWVLAIGRISEATLLGKGAVSPLLPAVPCGQSVAMQRQVSPDRKVPKVYTISNLEALSDLIAGLRLELTDHVFNRTQHVAQLRARPAIREERRRAAVSSPRRRLHKKSAPDPAHGAAPGAPPVFRWNFPGAAARRAAPFVFF